ncbi:MAG: HlyD family type I secretion periplasmic adaptor subunit [Solirubrobacterales bacterium]
MSPELEDMVRSPRRLGYTAALTFFGGVTLFSALVPLASAAVAPGVVSPDGSRKTIQHLEGGIVRLIHVREGDAVMAGQPLVTLEDTKARAQYQELRERTIHLLTTQARLLAEQSGAEAVSFPAELDNFPQSEVAQAAASQRQLFEDRRAARQGEERVLRQRIAQLDEEIAGLRQTITAQDEQLRLIAEETEGVRQLVDKGLERVPRLLALKRERARIEGERAAHRADIARDQQRIGETETQLLGLRQQTIEKVSDELAKVTTELSVHRSQFPLHQDILARTVVTAPMDGTVLHLRVTTEAGGVVGPGQPLLDLVPSKGGLVIDARVKPNDIEMLHPGLKAKVVLTAYRQRMLPQIMGELRSISADRLTDDRSGEPYFLAKVEVDPAELAALSPDVRLIAGMPAEVMVLTGERSLLSYLMRPLTDSFRRSFRED